ncbi:MAG TPA: hypothetical protein VH370_06730 [Humisphaera sp.]|jgi:hypothetical protein|nr:hypothetical protein [Humisphaera sp.]
MKRRSRHRRGYVLVATLGLLVLASTLLVTTGRLAVRHALLARQNQEELQRRWGAISARNAILPYAEQILARAEATDNHPRPLYRATVQLGADSFELIVADEQAKANINTVLEQTDKSAAEARLHDAISGSGLGNAISLHPEPLQSMLPSGSRGQPSGPPPPQQWISGWGQVFDNLALPALIEGPNPATSNFTCWGSGATNIIRAGAPALRAVGGSLTQLDVSRLIDARNAAWDVRSKLLPTGGQTSVNSSADAVTRLLSAAKISPGIRARVAMTDRSTCHSLWIIVKDRQRRWYQFMVLDESNVLHARTEAFFW